jgi:hypothetical protein
VAAQPQVRSAISVDILHTTGAIVTL